MNESKCRVNEKSPLCPECRDASYCWFVLSQDPRALPAGTVHWPLHFPYWFLTSCTV